MTTISTLEMEHKPVADKPEELCDLLVGIDPLGRITFLHYINPDAAEKLGYTEQEIVGTHVIDLLIGADSISAIEHFGRLYASEDAFRAPDRQLKTKSGGVIDAETYVVPSYDDTRKFIGHYAMIFLKK